MKQHTCIAYASGLQALFVAVRIFGWIVICNSLHCEILRTPIGEVDRFPRGAESRKSTFVCLSFNAQTP